MQNVAIPIPNSITSQDGDESQAITKIRGAELKSSGFSGHLPLVDAVETEKKCPRIEAKKKYTNGKLLEMSCFITPNNVLTQIMSQLKRSSNAKNTSFHIAGIRGPIPGDKCPDGRYHWVNNVIFQYKGKPIPN